MVFALHLTLFAFTGVKVPSRNSLARRDSRVFREARGLAGGCSLWYQTAWVAAAGVATATAHISAMVSHGGVRPFPPSSRPFGARYP